MDNGQLENEMPLDPSRHNKSFLYIIDHPTHSDVVVGTSGLALDIEVHECEVDGVADCCLDDPGAISVKGVWVWVVGALDVACGSCQDDVCTVYITENENGNLNDTDHWQKISSNSNM